MIDRLQTGGIFACHCQSDDEGIEVGILVIDYDRVFPGRVAGLLDPESGSRYEVIIPAGKRISYGARLRWAA